jgi:hypothetical protein
MLLLLLLAVAPKPGSAWTLTIVAEENLHSRAKTLSGDEKHRLDAKLRVKVDTVKGDRADGVTVESPKAEFPTAVVREDSGAPVVAFKGPQPGLATTQVLREAYGRLVVEDPEREAMSSCTANTQAATELWLKKSAARVNQTQPEDVTLTDLVLKCTATKTGTKLDVSFATRLPRATLTVEATAKGTLTVDKNVWATMWKLAGKVHVQSPDAVELEVDGTFSTSMGLAPGVK